MSELLGIYGARGHGRDVLLFAGDSHDGEIVFIDDDTGLSRSHGLRVLTLDAFMSESSAKKIAVAVADTTTRARLYERLQGRSAEIVSLVARSAVVWRESEIGVGSLIGPHATVSTGVKAGIGLIANTHSAIAHDCMIGDFVTIGPGAKVNGCVVIGDGATIGAGAVIKQGTIANPRTIGRNAVVGMGAVVTKDVPDGATVIGNPARPIVPA